MRIGVLLLGIVLLCCGCRTKDDGINQIPMEDPIPFNGYVPSPGTSFEWRLDDLPPDFTTSVDVIDIDAFQAAPELVASLQAQGVKVFGYISVGSVEDFRPDAADFPSHVIGNIYEGFPDERWLDISRFEDFADIMEARLDMIEAKGFDGVEPDNINGYQNNTGFNLSQGDAIAYSRWLIARAHERNLSIGHKNAEELIDEMVDEFDWILAEDAYVEDFYQQLTPYIDNDKAVFMVEYTDRISEDDFQTLVCPVAATLDYFAVLKDRDLTDTTFYCD